MRKLGIFALGFAGAVFAAQYLLPSGSFPVCAAVCAGAFLFALIFRSDAGKRAAIFLLAAALGFGCFAGWSALTIAPARAFAGSGRTVQAQVVEYPAVYEDYSVATLKLRGDAPHLRVMAYGDFADRVPGDLVSFTADFKPADERYGKPWSRYTAEGVYLVAYVKGEVSADGQSGKLLFFPQTLAKGAAGIIGRLMPDASGAFVTALLLGDKRGLYDNPELYCALGDAGILHIVAVSGMHVAFLIGFLRLLLRKKRAVCLIGIPLIWLFALIAGATPSVLRAAVMQTIVLTAPLLGRETDGLTSLSAALILLLAVNPGSCASVSLQLSFAAMLGMLLFSGKINRALVAKLRNNGLHKSVNKLLYAVCSAFSASVGAMVFTVPLMALHFGFVSLYSIVVNIIIFWAVSADFILGGLAAIAGAVWLPLGTPFAWCCRLLSGYIMGVAELFSSLPYAVISTGGNVFAWMLIGVYIIFTAWYLLGRRRLSAIAPAGLSVCLLSAAIIFTELSTGSSLAMLTALDVGQGQCLLLTEGGASMMVDCGGRNTAENAGDTASRQLLAEGRRSLDVLALTHFDYDHISGVERLLCRIEVKNLVIPATEEKAGRELAELAQRHGAKVYIIDDDALFTVGGLSLTAFEPVSSEKPELIFLASHEKCDILITGDADEEAEARFLLKNELPDTEIFLAGHHGSKHASTGALIAAAKAETAIISVGYNSYGHPAPETLERFAEAGMRIFRTDEMGSITLPLGE